MKVEDVLHCSFQNWYEDFKEVTPESIIIPLPEGFTSYLLKDGIVLPKTDTVNQVDCSNDDSEEDWDTSEDDVPEAPNFPEFDEQIKLAIVELGGKVFPKLNWSSPRDASWIGLNNSCCCSSVSDVYLLLKSSDFVAHDLTSVFSRCTDYLNHSDGLSQENGYFLVLRKWMEIDPSGEFRCFVKDGSLIGICQREHSLFFDHIGFQRNDIVRDIMLFYCEHLQFKFRSTNYVFDVYRKKEDTVYLIDFNPFDVTDALLFEWHELIGGLKTTGDHSLPEFRYVRHNRGVQPKPFSYHAMPRDIIDISSGEDSYKLVDLIKLKINEQNQDTSDNDENDDSKWKI